MRNRQDMLWLYTIFTTIFGIFLLPVTLVMLAIKKYRARILQRLGLTLDRNVVRHQPGRQPVIWMHALSVGEVTSALPLLREIRRRYPGALCYFSATTSSGYILAGKEARELVDAIFFGPFDFPPAILRYHQLLKPSLFILVETDIWPGWLFLLSRRRIPLFLVNGRFSPASRQRYLRFAFLFRSVFRLFSVIATQTTADSRFLTELGVATDRIVRLGNLKFDAQPLSRQPMQDDRLLQRPDLGLCPTGPLLVCGSTHPGEEELLFAAWHHIRKQFPQANLLVAPRDIDRRHQIVALARKKGLDAALRSETGQAPSSLVILDTLGELACCYRLADVAFIGGSLVAAGGHNPLEAASWAIPVLFGPHMEDFSEISQGLLSCGGALQVRTPEDLIGMCETFFSSASIRQQTGARAGRFVTENQGVVRRHLEYIDALLAGP